MDLRKLLRLFEAKEIAAESAVTSTEAFGELEDPPTLETKSSTSKRRKRRTNRANPTKLAALLLDLLQHAYEQQYVLELVSKYFKANAAVFWVRDLHTVDDFYAYSSFNRADILIGENNSFFSLSDSNVISTQSFQDGSPVHGDIGEPPFGDEWLSKPYTIGLRSIGVRYVYLFPGTDEASSPCSVLSLYFRGRPDFGYLSSQLPIVASFVQSLVTKLISEVDAMHGEHRKTGHEIDAAARSVLGALKKLTSTLSGKDFRLPSSVDDNINDARTAISVIREAATQSKFADSVRRGRLTATHNNLREEFNSATQPLLASVPPARVELFPLQIEGGYASILMSENHLRQIIDNLMSNAIKYSTNGGTIRAMFTRGGDSATSTLMISNTCVGLPATEWSKIWNQRYRGRNARNSSTPGEGVGLAIVREICEVYGVGYRYTESTSNGNVHWSHLVLTFPNSMVRWARG